MTIEPASAGDTISKLGSALEGWPFAVLVVVALSPLFFLLGPLLHRRLTPQTANKLMFAVIAIWIARLKRWLSGSGKLT